MTLFLWPAISLHWLKWLFNSPCLSPSSISMIMATPVHNWNVLGGGGSLNTPPAPMHCEAHMTVQLSSDWDPFKTRGSGKLVAQLVKYVTWWYIDSLQSYHFCKVLQYQNIQFHMAYLHYFEWCLCTAWIQTWELTVANSNKKPSRADHPSTIGWPGWWQRVNCWASYFSWGIRIRPDSTKVKRPFLQHKWIHKCIAAQVSSAIAQVCSHDKVENGGNWTDCLVGGFLVYFAVNSCQFFVSFVGFCPEC